MRQIDIGSVIIHPAGTNPYSRYDYPERMGSERIKALHLLRAGKLPATLWAWDDRNRERITDPNVVDWVGLRD